MATLSDAEMIALLRPYLDITAGLAAQLSVYLDLLLKWNARTNLTAIRDPEEIVRRHFGESLFVGLHLPCAGTLLDFGSGAGFPGLPIQLLRPELVVTLAESQNKKASFLREAVRALDLPTQVWSSRVESMPQVRRFDCLTLRAVDNMEAALAAGLPRVGQTLALMTTDDPPEASGFVYRAAILLPESRDRRLLLADRV